MKSEIFVQYSGREFNTKTLEDRAKEIWKANGNKVKDLETLSLYIKPEDNKCYFVFNGQGSEENYINL